ncbi:MAG TPA: histidine kinase dimerization/phospho-acceptor domain-containing protein, partial [Tepidisphaeraceae bacterium]|nr:histidine kinase dimerization/phospho-acceptor domain-containing protein [Tepidisphaeraceae bacterium]
MHPLLARQLKRLVGEQMLDPAAIPSPWKELVAAVDSAYIAGDADRALIERSMEIASEELFQRNRELVVNNAALEAAKIEQRKAHDELEFRVAQRTAQLRAAMEQAEAANQSKSAFLANMSHEIRTPMSAILGYADMLLAEDRSRQQQIDCIQTIRRQGEHLLAILNDILDLSKIEAGKLLVETVNCDPCRIVADALSLMRVRALEKQLTCEALYVGQIPKSIRTDPTRLRQILINLLGNAIKFTKSGEVRLIVSFDVEAPKTAPRIKFEIQDSGIGM